MNQMNWGVSFGVGGVGQRQFDVVTDSLPCYAKGEGGWLQQSDEQWAASPPGKNSKGWFPSF